MANARNPFNADKEGGAEEAILQKGYYCTGSPLMACFWIETTSWILWYFKIILLCQFHEQFQCIKKAFKNKKKKRCYWHHT